MPSRVRQQQRAVDERRTTIPGGSQAAHPVIIAVPSTLEGASSRGSRHHRGTSDHPRPRLRLAVHAAHCPPAARAVGLQRRSCRSRRLPNPARAPSRRHHPARADRAAPTTPTHPRARSGRLRPGRACPRHLLRHAGAHEASRRVGRHQHPSRIRPRAGPRGPGPALAPLRRAARGAQGVGEPRRPRHRAAARGLRRRGHLANAPVAAMEAPDRGFYGLLFHPEVAHTDHGREILRNFAFGVCGCTGDWTIAVVHRRGDRRASGADGHGTRRLRPVGRRRFHRGGGADPQGHRRPAHVHLRRQRPAAPRTKPRRSWSASGSWPLPAALRGRERRVPRASSRASPIRSRSARSSAATFIDVFEREAKSARRRSTSSRRARSIPT